MRIRAREFSSGVQPVASAVQGVDGRSHFDRRRPRAGFAQTASGGYSPASEPLTRLGQLLANCSDVQQRRRTSADRAGLTLGEPPLASANEIAGPTRTSNDSGTYTDRCGIGHKCIQSTKTGNLLIRGFGVRVPGGAPKDKALTWRFLPVGAFLVWFIQMH